MHFFPTPKDLWDYLSSHVEQHGVDMHQVFLVAGIPKQRKCDWVNGLKAPNARSLRTLRLAFFKIMDEKEQTKRGVA